MAEKTLDEVLAIAAEKPKLFYEFTYTKATGYKLIRGMKECVMKTKKSDFAMQIYEALKERDYLINGDCLLGNGQGGQYVQYTD